MTVRWQVDLKLGKRKNLEPDGWAALVEQVRASVRAKVEHPFWDVKGIFHYAKSLPPSPIGVRYRGLAKNTDRLALLLGLSNLTRAQRLLAA